jgi:hypothetical protein
MTEEFVVIDPITVPLKKKKKAFPDGTTVIAKAMDAQWVQGKFSPSTSFGDKPGSARFQRQLLGSSEDVPPAFSSS